MAYIRESKFLKHVPSIVSILLGIIAVFLSWRAYQISNETKNVILNQMRPNVLLVDLKRGGIAHYLGYQDSHHYVCARDIRLQNVGGLPTSLVRYDVVISLHKEGLTFSSGLYESYTYSETGMPPAVSRFTAAIFSENKETSIETSSGDFSKALDLPIQIEAYSSIGLSLATHYNIDWTENPFDSTLDSQNALRVSYILHFASGQAVEIPPYDCQYLK